MPVDEMIPDVPEPGSRVSLVGIVAQYPVETRSQMPIELVDQVVLALEICEERSLGDPCSLGDCRGWGA